MQSPAGPTIFVYEGLKQDGKMGTEGFGRVDDSTIHAQFRCVCGERRRSSAGRNSLIGLSGTSRKIQSAGSGGSKDSAPPASRPSRSTGLEPNGAGWGASWCFPRQFFGIGFVCDTTPDQRVVAGP